MRGSMASLPQLGLRPRASRLRDASASGHPLPASARMNRQPRIRRRISKRFGGCGSNPSQQQRPRDDRNAVSGSWSRRRDLRLWRRAPVHSPQGWCSLRSCFFVSCSVRKPLIRTMSHAPWRRNPFASKCSLLMSDALAHVSTLKSRRKKTSSKKQTDEKRLSVFGRGDGI